MSADESHALGSEDAITEITVASYNVENLFDQVDDAASEGYGDYRIRPNSRGMSSNWGEGAQFEGARRSFTDIKIAGIRKVLMAITPRGPDIVGLVEIESQRALDALLAGVRDLGYTTAFMADVPRGTAPTAVHVAIISKLPISEATSLVPPMPARQNEPLRAIVRAKVDVSGYPLYVYVNHWKSKSGGESLRVVSAKTLADDINALKQRDPLVDYVILGDLNSDYNENITIEPQNNDTNGRTGINDILKAQGDEMQVAQGAPGLNYDLYYELRREDRHTAWYPDHGWSALDHMIIGPGLYDSSGLVYVDNSFRIATAQAPNFAFLFDQSGHPRRWRGERRGRQTIHSPGGYSDHLPIFAKFQVKRRQDEGRIQLTQPGVPDQQ